MNVLVLGAGAVGLVVAGRLSRVCRVHAVCRQRHADAVAQQGLVVTGIWGDATLRFPCAATAPEGEDFDYVIVTSKSVDTETICAEFHHLLAGTEVVSLQNGLGNEEIIGRYSDRVVGGTIITGFEWRGDARVHVSVEAGPIKLGRFPAGVDGPVERLAGLFREAGLNVEATDTIRSSLWAKTLYNCALNPLGAVMGVPYGALAHPSTWSIIGRVVREAFAVCTAEGVALPWATPDDYLGVLRDTQLPATAGHRSSMLQDIERGNPTEIDFINGAVVSRGREQGVATPVNSTLVDLIRFKESLAAG